MLRRKVLGTFLLSACLLPNYALAQTAMSATTAAAPSSAAKIYAAPKADIDKIRDEGMNRSQVPQTLSYLTDVIGGRLTNSPSMKRANEWTRDTMTKWGMQNARLEAWGPFGRGWSLKDFNAKVVAPQPLTVIAYPKAWSPSTKGDVTGEVVFLDARTEADLAKYKGQLRGKIVLAVQPRELKAEFEGLGKRRTDEELAKLAAAPDPNAAAPAATQQQQASPEQLQQFRQAQLQTARRMSFLLDEGAAVIVDTSAKGSGGTLFVSGASVAQVIPAKEEDFFTAPRLTAYQKEAEARMIPQMTMATEDYNRLVRMIRQGIKPQMTVNIQAQYHDDDLMGYNTIAEIPGTDPQLKDEIVMVGAHLDSWHSAGGATDNAAGSAVAMEAARIILASNLKPRRTIRVALWSGEEQGLHGSREYVKQQFGEMKGAGQGQRGELVKTPNYEKFSAYYNLDNGTGKIRGVYMQGNSSAAPIFKTWLEPFKDLGATTITLANTGGTDHQSFDRIGLPGFQFIQDEIEYSTRTHHSNQDTFDRIQADDMKQAATIMAAFAYQTAMMDEKLPRKTIR